MQNKIAYFYLNFQSTWALATRAYIYFLVFGFFFFFFLDFFLKIKYVMGAFWKKNVKVVKLPQFKSLGG
jgi:hypothetical protein